MVKAGGAYRWEKPRLQRLERLVGDVNGLQWEERTEAMVETCRRSR